MGTGVGLTDWFFTLSCLRYGRLVGSGVTFMKYFNPVCIHLRVSNLLSPFEDLWVDCSY